MSSRTMMKRQLGSGDCGRGEAMYQHVQPLTTSADWLAWAQAEAGCGNVCFQCFLLDLYSRYDANYHKHRQHSTAYRVARAPLAGPAPAHVRCANQRCSMVARPCVAFNGNRNREVVRRLPQQLWGWRRWRLPWCSSACGCSTPKLLLPSLPQLSAPASQANRPAALPHNPAACCLCPRAKGPN